MALKYRHTLLLVDDEESITRALRRLLRNEGYEIYTAGSGQEGVEQLKEAGKPFSMIISDQRMPGMNGAQFLEKAKETFPQAIRILLTGYSDMDAIVEAVNKGEIHRYMTKPWNDDEMVLQIRQALAHYELETENRRLLALTRKQNRELSELNKHLEEKVEERSREIIEKNKTLSRLNRELEASFYNTVKAFGSLAELNTPNLTFHANRVSSLSHDMALLLDLDEKEVTHIEIAALLHDIGKLGFPQRLLGYREKSWSRQENELYRKHPEQGQAVIQFVDRLDYVSILIRSHHEWYNGKGYPDQLKGEEIPLGARIIAIANAYDKVVNLKLDLDTCTSIENASDQTLQKAAFTHLKHHARTRYDPEIVKLCIDLLQKRMAPSDAGHKKENQRRVIRVREERRVSVHDLEAGMVLARSLYSTKGQFLLNHRTTLTEKYIRNLKTLHMRELVGDIYVLG